MSRVKGPGAGTAHAGHGRHVGARETTPGLRADPVPADRLISAGKRPLAPVEPAGNTLHS